MNMPLSMILMMFAGVIAAPHLRPTLGAMLALAIALWALIIGVFEVAIYG